jgi:hypothetical protein
MTEEVKRRRGRLNRSRGNAFEREVAAKLNGKRVGQYGGKTDAENDWIVAQCKVGTSYPERIDRWLRALMPKADQLRAVVLGDSPGSGRGKRRTLIVLDFDEFVDWFGKREEK